MEQTEKHNIRLGISWDKSRFPTENVWIYKKMASDDDSPENVWIYKDDRPGPIRSSFLLFQYIGH